MSRAIFGCGLALLTFVSVIGCEKPIAAKKYPSVAPRTSAPPGAITEYTEDATRERRSIRLTEGVAMAFECRDTSYAPCALDGSAVNDEAVAGFRRAYGDLDQTVVTGQRSQTQRAYVNRSLFVVVARRAGTTTLALQTGEATVLIDVQVFPAK